jgi:hypothetical protein
MPFPLTFLAGKTFARPTYRNPIPSLADLILSHYAIKGPRNQSTETILQTFDHVTEGTVADPPWLIPCTKFLHFVELIFRFLLRCLLSRLMPAKSPAESPRYDLAATATPDGSGGQMTSYA